MLPANPGLRNIFAGSHSSRSSMMAFKRGAAHRLLNDQELKMALSKDEIHSEMV
jgi:hypothetical protein